MLYTKIFEVRDSATFIPVIAFHTGFAPCTHRERYLLGRAGYSPNIELVLLGRLNGTGKLFYDPHAWGPGRTYQVAHQYIAANWDELESGDVIDVEFILGETPSPKPSEEIA